MNRPVIMPGICVCLLITAILILSGQGTCFATTVGLQWSAMTDPGIAGYKVYYQADSSVQPFTGTGAAQGASPVDVQTQTSATISGLDPSHAYSFAVTAYYTSGVESSYSNIVSVPEMVPPTISISSPASNASVSGVVSVTANASDNVGVTKVEFYVNGVLKATDTAAPYAYSWDTSSLTAGSYTLTAKAYDAAGNIGQSGTVSVTVVKDTTAPTVSVTSPANGAAVSGTVTITASAADNVGVSSVEFYANTTLLSVTNVSPYRFNWNTTTFANGNYSLTAKAYDAAGNVGQSQSVTITVSNSGVQPPASNIPGDINGDGVLDISDALLALRFAVGLETPTADQLARGDVGPLVNGKPSADGKIDINDAVVILSAVVGNITL
jgi:glutamine cyclotransferase